MSSAKNIVAIVVVLAIAGLILFRGGAATSPGPTAVLPSASAAETPAATATPSVSAIATLATLAPLGTSPPAVNFAGSQQQATAFATTYLAYVYARTSDTSTITNVTEETRGRLPQTRGNISPNEQQRPYTIPSVVATPIQPEGTLIVEVSVAEGAGGAAYHVHYTMALYDGVWKTNQTPTFGS